MKSYPVIGIRPIIDARRLGIRDELEGKTASMAQAAMKLISEHAFYSDGTRAKCVIADTSISGSEEAARCQEKFRRANVVATLSVTPSWCYPMETIDIDPLTIKAIWGFNGTERPGAVYLASALSAHNEVGIPVFSIYGRDVQDMEDDSIPADVAEKILRFAQCSIAVGEMRNKSYVGFGGVSMGIMGSFIDPKFLIHYLGIRPEWVDMTEILRRIEYGIYDHKEYEKALSWIKANCPEGFDKNLPQLKHTDEQKEEEWKFIAKMTLVIRDIMFGNPKLAQLDDGKWKEEALGKNAVFAGFQGQRAWTDWKPNADFTEAILNSTFDWNGIRQPAVFATEGDNNNGIAMLFENLLTGQAAGFSDVRCYWSPSALKRVTGWDPTGKAENGFIHLINSGSTCLDGCGASIDEEGKPAMKKWWKVTEEDEKNCLKMTDWCPASLTEFRGGGFSSHFLTNVEMPVTMARLNLVDGIGPTLQIAEGNTVVMPTDVFDKINKRTDRTWPSTFFAPRLTGKGAFSDTYTMMSEWGANHGAWTYGHIGADLITLCAMLRIPVTMHNVSEDRIFRPHVWGAFGDKGSVGADIRACEYYGPVYG
ncbi:L-fucose isomerase [Porcincola intestinalis]|uniref:L-fucose isomerase n=1 Tax=Porcincola intestinalis TaxID=2606632 RepID=A0A6L5X189_9FIRM|nr:L-fucose isomerase [Porcincola intestinalis]MSS14111.1 L-fucose isomerase [Porcincola intestinalis]